MNDSPELKLSYIGERPDLLALVPPSAKRVLDVGCSVGTLAGQIAEVYGSEVTGVELDEQMAEMARAKCHRVISANVERLNLEEEFEKGYFDCIIFGDVLEHLNDPWELLKRINPFLSNDGVVIACMPNIRHCSSIIDLVFRGYWPYRERGVHDRTHVRFFTLRNIREMFSGADLKISFLKRKYRLLDRASRINRLTRILNRIPVPIIREFLTFQYLVIADKSSGE